MNKNEIVAFCFVFIIGFLFCFPLSEALEAKSKAVKDSFNITVYNQENETLPDCLVEIETSINIYRKFTNSDGVVKFKVRKKEGEAPKYKISKDGYKTTVGFLLYENRNAAGNLIIKLERV